MRLTALSLTRYGNFADERIAFDPTPGRLNILLAPNGAGKSVLRGAFCDLLFGIGNQTPMGFRFGYQGMRVMAEAVLPDGAAFAFGRRKGQGNTLIGADNAPLDPRAIAAALGQTDRALLERLFALDTERLRQGEAELFESNGALADALLSGAGGFRHARRLSQTLAEARDAKAPQRRASQRPFYQALEKFNDARRRKAAAQLRPEQWQREQAELDEIAQRQHTHNARSAAASADIARLERIRRVTPWLAAHDAAASWLAAHPEAPALEPGLAGRLADARAAIVRATDAVRLHGTRAEQLVEQHAAVAVDDALLAEAEAIDQLVDNAGAARQAAADLPGVTARLDARRSRVAELLRQLGRDLPADRAQEAVPSRTLIGRTRRLIADGAAREEAVREGPARVQARERERAAITAQLAALPQAAAPAALERLAKEILSDGEPAARRNGSAAALAAAQAELDAALARVPGWTGSADALAGFAPLGAGLYERLDANRQDALAALQARQTAHDEASQARADAARVLTTLMAAGPPPDAASLTGARERRDAGWHLIYRLAFTPAPPSDAEQQAFGGGLPLPLAYERAVAGADDLADRRIDDAAAIERVETARQALVAADARLAEAEQRLRLAREAAEATERAWRQVSDKLPLGPAASLRDVQGFLAAREQVLDMRRRLAIAAAADAALAERQAEWAGRLAAELAAGGLGAPVGRADALADAPQAAARDGGANPASLPDLLRRAEQAIAAARQGETARTRLAARLDAAEQALDEAKAGLAAAQSGLEAWRAEWRSVLAALGRPADETRAVTEDVLQDLAELDQQRQEAAALAELASDMQKRNTDFAAAVARLSGEAALTDPFAAVADLRGRLRLAREAARQRAVLDEQARAARDEAVAAARGLDQAETELRAVLTMIGAATEEDAQVRLILAAERSRHAASLSEAEAKLLALSDGLPLAALREATRSVPSDDVPALIEQAMRNRDAASQAAQAAAAEAAALRQRMAQQAADEAIHEAAAAQNAAAATIGRVLEEALVLHVAATMLERSLASLERQDEPALLRRISSLFEALTNGAYSRVVTELDSDNVPRITLIPRDVPDERVPVQGLSEGTRDQLYLALRLAAIGAHVARAPALPFIADDILQTFDDERALAALRVLREVSEQTQVIVLTHHRHILDLARRLPDSAVNLCAIDGIAQAVG